MLSFWEWLLTHPCVQGESILDYWKAKVPIADVLDGKPIGRSITGLKRAVARMFEKGKPKADAILLKNYEKLVERAKVLAPSVLMATPSEDLLSALEMMQKENVILPEGTRYALVLREAQRRVEAGDHKGFLNTISFWGQGTFSLTEPVLAALESHSSKKIGTWQTMFFQDLLLPFVYGGVEQSDKVLSLCTLALDVTSSVDLVMVDGPTASALDESNAICNFFKSLLTPSAIVTAEARLLTINMILPKTPNHADDIHTWLAKIML